MVVCVGIGKGVALALGVLDGFTGGEDIGNFVGILIRAEIVLAGIPSFIWYGLST